MGKPTLKNYIARHRIWLNAANKRTGDAREHCLRQVREADEKILEYVTSDNFYDRLDYLNL
jgi:hypothetical protein